MYISLQEKCLIKYKYVKYLSLVTFAYVNRERTLYLSRFSDKLYPHPSHHGGRALVLGSSVFCVLTR